MKVFKYILVALVFICLVVGFLLILASKMFVSKSKNTEDVAHRKMLKIKMIGYVMLMLSLAFGIFQSLITI